MPQLIPDITPSPRDLPIIGPWLGTIGRVKALTAAPCDPEPGIYALAAFMEAPNAVYTLFGPDCVDEAFDSFRGSKHHKGRRLRVKKGIMERGSPPTAGWGWKFFRAGELAQRIGWYVAVVDVTLDFTLNWTSLAYAWTGCDTPGLPRAYWLWNIETAGGIGDGNWHSWPMPLNFRHIMPADDASAFTTGDNEVTAIVRMTYVAETGRPPPTMLEVRCITEQGYNLLQASADEVGDDTHQVVARGWPQNLPDDTRIDWQIKWEGWFPNFLGTSRTLTQLPSGGTLDPINCGKKPGEVWEPWHNKIDALWQGWEKELGI